MMHITFIGGGNMATAIIAGLVKTGQCQISVVEPDADKREQLAQRFRVSALAQLPVYFGSGQVVVLAVKPQQLRDVCDSLAGRLDGALVLSIAAGVGVPALSRWLDGHDRIVRVMPNTPAMIGKGVAGLFARPVVDAQDRVSAEQIMSAAGSTVWLSEESGIDDITAISGSGPAYVFYFLESLIESARQLGFDPATARELALSTFEGAVALARHSGEDIATLRANVTSKGGTTEQAIASFEASGLKSAILRGAKACRARSIELGEQLSQD